MTLRLPRNMRDFNLDLEGEGTLGLIQEIDLPTLQDQTEEHQGGGMIAPEDIPVGFLQKLEATFTLAGHVERLRRHLDQEVRTIVRAVVQAQGEDKLQARIVMRGRVTTATDRSNLQRNEKNNESFTINPHLYREELDGRELVHIDNRNRIMRVDGKDLYERVREILGD